MGLSLDVDVIIALAIVLSFVTACLGIIVWQLVRRGYLGRTVVVNMAGDGTQRIDINELMNSSSKLGSLNVTTSLRKGGVPSAEVEWEDITLGPLLGKGSFGVVYKAQYRGSNVAVKTLLDQSLNSKVLKEFESECSIFAELRHPNIILFMGVVTTAPHLSIVTEFLPLGALSGVLLDERVHLSRTQKVNMILDVSRGMAYLHTNKPPIFHRDLKSPNILVDSNYTLKVCDFGLAGLFPDLNRSVHASETPLSVLKSGIVNGGHASTPCMNTQVSEAAGPGEQNMKKCFGLSFSSSRANTVQSMQISTNVPLTNATKSLNYIVEPPPKSKKKSFAGTILWAAPEVLLSKEFTASADIYSFGIVVWEVAMRMKPYSNTHPLSVGYQVMRQDLRPSPLPTDDDFMRDLIVKCWATDPKDRPENFVAIAKQVEKFRDEEGLWRDSSARPTESVLLRSSPANSELSSTPSSLFDGVEMLRASVVLASVTKYPGLQLGASTMATMSTTIDEAVDNVTMDFTCHSEKLTDTTYLRIFEDPVDAMCWALTLQDKLLDAPWSKEVLETEEMKPIRSEKNKARILYKGPRMGVFISFSKTIIRQRDMLTKHSRYTGSYIENIKNFDIIASNGRVLVPRELFESTIEEELDMECLSVKDGGIFQSIPLLEVLPRHLEERYHHPTVPKLTASTKAMSRSACRRQSNLSARPVLSHILLNDADVTITDVEVPRYTNEIYPMMVGQWHGIEVWCRKNFDEDVNSVTSALSSPEMEITIHVRHPNIVALMGFVIEPVLTCVYESFKHGPLSSFIFDLSNPLTMHVRLDMVLDIAKAIHFLHMNSPSIVHQRLSRHTVFVTRKYEAKLGGFSHAVSSDDEQIFQKGRLKDVQALGVLMFELVMREEWDSKRFDDILTQSRTPCPLSQEKKNDHTIDIDQSVCADRETFIAAIDLIGKCVFNNGTQPIDTGAVVSRLCEILDIDLDGQYHRPQTRLIHSSSAK
eukprot:CFRG5573T1